ncbi:hypothetical protein [Rhizobium metallidurans]|uniref:Uncharacterized protein n=1 Tax=Rhizobium metallidurans TaxID=1265931 RepID=A0A7W6CWT6_9HYPH|nr:hypothetical protein [Rhizobium metallidurans]MBB3965929.1 hypothetical protein [Rhizobium metallidurans]
MQHITIEIMTQSAEQAEENRRRNVRDLGILATALFIGLFVGTCSVLVQMQHAADIASRV